MRGFFEENLKGSTQTTYESEIIMVYTINHLIRISICNRGKLAPMALVDFVIVGLAIAFAVISWISSRDGSPMINTSSSSSIDETKLPGLDDVPIMDKIAKKSASTASVAIPVATEEKTPAKEIPEFDEVEKDSPKMAKIECPMCSQIIEVEEKGILQDLVCDSCGFKGELEV